MMNRLVELWRAADDGAMAPVGPIDHHSEAEFDNLFDAWLVERRNSIECQLMLEQVRDWITRLAAVPVSSRAKSRQARRLVRSIDRTLKMINTGTSD